MAVFTFIRTCTSPCKGFSVLLTACLFLLCSVQGFAQDKTWTGNNNANWHSPGNWTPAGVPDPTDDVLIIPNGGNPFPIISNDNASVASLQIGDYRTGELTVQGSQTLNISNGLTLDQGGSGGSLIIQSGGAVNLTGGTFTMTQSNAFIEVDNGSFSSDVDVTINGDGFLAGDNVDLNFNAGFNMQNGKSFSVQSGSVSIANNAVVNGPFGLGSSTFDVGGTLKVNSGKTFDTQQATVTIEGETTINGTYNGDDGITNFNDKTTVTSGGVINLDSGEIHFNNGAQISSNGTANLGSGTVEFQGDVTVVSSGYFNVQDATVNITGNADFTSNGNLTIDNGSINVLGNANLTSGGSFNLNNGAFNVGGNASFVGGGTVDAGNSEINLKGDFTLDGGATFTPGTSNVTFSGDDTQTINTNGANLNFYDVTVNDGATIQTDGSTENTITVENNLTVEEGGQVNVQGDDTIDVQGNINGDGNVDSPRPFISAIFTPSTTSVLITFNKAMNEAPAENTANYSIDNGIAVSNAVLNLSDPTKVTLTVSTLSEGIEYELTANNLTSTDGGEISNNHKKRFTLKTQKTYYSRLSGDWDTPSSWSTVSPTGAAATSIPNTESGNKAQIGNNNTITISSEQDVSNMNELLVENTGTLEVDNQGTLVLDDFTVIGNGTFTLLSGGTLDIGSADGIVAPGTDAGNIQTTQRNYSNQGNYIYSGSGSQQTGSGLPQQINDLTIDNTADVTATANIRTTGTLYLDNGSLIIPSGQALISNTKSIQNGSLVFQRVLSGAPGWRMISTPIATDYANFLDGILTQGYNGAQYDASVAPYDTLQPNVFYYDETFEGTDNQRFRAPDAAGTTVKKGTGYFAYLFGDVASDARYNDTLPDTLNVEGQEIEGTGGSFDFNITYTAEADTGFNLVGNPYGAALNWDDSGNWTKTNVDNTIYVWDPDTGDYKTWNGTTGSLGNGLITPFQAFWVKANAANPVLKADEDAKSFGGTFVGKGRPTDHPEIQLKLTQADRSNTIFFMFSAKAKVGKDAHDAYLLQRPPGAGNYTELFSVAENGTQFVINALPREFGVPIEIPIAANAYTDNHNTTTSANLSLALLKNIPTGWSVSLVDRKSGKTIASNTTASVNFTMPGKQKITSTQRPNDVLQEDYKILAKSDPKTARFLLRINPGSDADGLPKEVDLRQNYPNPAQTHTTIQFKLPIQNQVTLQVYNVLGQRVITLIDDQSFQAGLHKVDWNTSAVASGVYIYVLKTKDHLISKKLTIIK